MVFVAQLNLAEVAQLLPTSPLPRRGLLSFFLGVDAENKMPLPSGEPEERDAWSVLYQPDMAPLASVAYPGPTADLWQCQFPACRLTLAQRGPALPAEDAAYVQALVLSPIEMERYLDLLEQVNPDRQTWRLGHQLLGYPCDLQGNHMERLCARAFHGLDPYVVEGMDDPQTQRVEHEATAWTLLLQLNSDPHAELLWGDAGVLYWFIRRQELHAGRFETIWIQVQH
jgi:uncharacterized protein YwqG